MKQLKEKKTNFPLSCAEESAEHFKRLDKLQDELLAKKNRIAYFDFTDFAPSIYYEGACGDLKQRQMEILDTLINHPNTSVIVHLDQIDQYPINSLKIFLDSLQGSRSNIFFHLTENRGAMEGDNKIDSTLNARLGTPVSINSLLKDKKQ